MGIETIDLYYQHRDKRRGPLATASRVDELRAAGKIRSIGLSNFSAARVGEALDTALQAGSSRRSRCRGWYNLSSRQV